jgi:hypothetical protein
MQTASDLFSDPTQAQTRLSQLQRQLDDLATAMRFAKQTGQTVALDMFRGQFRELSRAAAQLRTELNASGAPPVLLQRMDAFADKAIAVAKEVGADASVLARGVAALPARLPWLVLGLAVAALALWALGRRGGR